MFYTTFMLQNLRKFVHFQQSHNPGGWPVLRCRIERVQMCLLFCAGIVTGVVFAPPHNDILVAYGKFNKNAQFSASGITSTEHLY